MDFKLLYEMWNTKLSNFVDKNGRKFDLVQAPYTLFAYVNFLFCDVFQFFYY